MEKGLDLKRVFAFEHAGRRLDYADDRFDGPVAAGFTDPGDPLVRLDFNENGVDPFRNALAVVVRLPERNRQRRRLYLRDSHLRAHRGLCPPLCTAATKLALGLSPRALPDESTARLPIVGCCSVRVSLDQTFESRRLEESKLHRDLDFQSAVPTPSL